MRQGRRAVGLLALACVGCNTFADLEARHPFHRADLASDGGSAPDDGADTGDDGIDGDASGGDDGNPGLVVLEDVFAAEVVEEPAVEVAVQSEPGDLLLAIAAPKPDRVVASVTGLGTEWTLVTAQCSTRKSSRIEVWRAQTAGGDGPVSMDYDSTPAAAVLGVLRFTGVDLEDPFVFQHRENTLGIDGDCPGVSPDTEGLDTDTYAVQLPDGGYYFGAVGIRLRTHEPADGVTERLELSDRALEGNAAGLVIVERPAGGEAAQLAGELSSAIDWSLVALGLRPR